MSFAAKPERPDSKDTARLRKEYEDKARQARETSDPASRAKLVDEKQKAFQRVVEQVKHERRENLKEVQRSLAKLGRFKTDDQLKEEKKKAEAESASARAMGVTKEKSVPMA